MASTSSSTNFALSALTADFTAFRTQLANLAAANTNWSGEYTSTTSQTLIDFAAAVGTYAVADILRAYEDTFSDTAVNDSAIRALATQQGLRLTRKLPAVASSCVLTSLTTQTIPAFTQFTCAGVSLFNRSAISIIANTPLTVDLYEGKVIKYGVKGLGTPRQTFISPEDSYGVSDQDVAVTINGTLIPRTLGVLWNYRGKPAFADLTTSDGRMLLVFGNSVYGSIPAATDLVGVTYIVTMGTGANGRAVNGKGITCTYDATMTGVGGANLTGGADETSVIAYKNLGASAFGSYDSAVTPAQYKATVTNYSGILDATVQAQRDIDTTDLKWMNVMRVSAITSSVWTSTQKQAYLDYLQSVCMYQPFFKWQDPVAVPQTLSFNVYCNNASQLTTLKALCTSAVNDLFKPRPQYLNLNLYRSDVEAACKKAAPNLISYFVWHLPTTDGFICNDGSVNAPIAYNTLSSLTINAFYTTRPPVVSN